MDELCQFTWERIRNDAENIDLEDHNQNKDPSRILGDICTFTQSKQSVARGTMSALPGTPGYGDTGGYMKWKLSQFTHPSTRDVVTCCCNGPPAH